MQVARVLLRILELLWFINAVYMLINIFYQLRWPSFYVIGFFVVGAIVLANWDKPIKRGK